MIFKVRPTSDAAYTGVEAVLNHQNYWVDMQRTGRVRDRTKKEMSKRDELIGKYAGDIRDKLGVEPDMDLLRKVTIGCGPSIYNNDAETVAASDEAELDRIRKNYLMKKNYG